MIRKRTLWLLAPLVLAACSQPDSPNNAPDAGTDRPDMHQFGRPGLPTVPVEVVTLHDGELWRPQQDVDLIVDATSLGKDRLSLELWSQGSLEEDAGNGVRFHLGTDGQASAEVRWGTDLTVVPNTATPKLPSLAGHNLRLRLRKDAGQRSLLHIDAQSGTGVPAGDPQWLMDEALFVIDPDYYLIGRRTVLLEPASGAQVPLAQNPIPPAGAFSFNQYFDGLIDWKVFQRDSRGKADIPVSFAYRADGTAQIQVQIVDAGTGQPLSGFSYKDQSFPLRAAPAGTRAQVVLKGVPQGGNYHLVGQLLPRGGGAALGTDTVSNIAVGDVFLAIGQSNMTGFGDLTNAEPPVFSVHLFGNDYRWKQASEPMDDGTDQVDRISAEDPGHSLMLRFAKEVAAGAGVPVAIIPGPRYGTNLTSGDMDSWQNAYGHDLDRGTLYGSAVYRVLSQGYQIPIKGVIFHQGEGDAGAGTDNYLQHLTQLVADLRADLKGDQIFFGNCQLETTYANTQQDLDDYLAIQEAERQAVALIPHSTLVSLIDLPRNPDDMYHLTTPGYKETGKRLAYAVLSAAYGVSRPLGPQLVSIRFAAGANSRIEMTYDKPVTGGLASLYQVQDARGPLKVAGLNVAGSKVTLTLSSAAQGNTLVNYGYSVDQGAIWVRAMDQSGAALVFRELPVMP